MHCTELSLAGKDGAQWGRSRCWEPGKVCALAPGTRAAFPQVPWQRRCQQQQLCLWIVPAAPHGKLSQAQPLVQTKGPRKLRTGSALVTPAPRSFPAPSDLSLRRELCTRSPNTDFPSLFRTLYFCCVLFVTGFFQALKSPVPK